MERDSLGARHQSFIPGVVRTREVESPCITQFYKWFSCLENFKDVGEYSFDEGAKMRVRGISDHTEFMV